MVYTLVDITDETLDVDEKIILQIPYFAALLSVKDQMGTNVDGNKITLEDNIKVSVMACVVRFVEVGCDLLKLVNSKPVKNSSVNIVEVICLLDFLGFCLERGVGSISADEMKVVLRFINEGCDLLNLVSFIPLNHDIVKLREMVRLLDTLGFDLDCDTGDKFTTNENLHFSIKKQTCYVNESKKRARETAAKIAIGLHKARGDMYLSAERKQALFFHVMYIVSHPAEFGIRLRKHTYCAAKEGLWWGFSKKQWRQIDKYSEVLYDWEDSTDCYDSEKDCKI